MLGPASITIFRLQIKHRLNTEAFNYGFQVQALPTAAGVITGSGFEAGFVNAKRRTIVVAGLLVLGGGGGGKAIGIVIGQHHR